MSIKRRIDDYGKNFYYVVVVVICIGCGSDCFVFRVWCCVRLCGFDEIKVIGMRYYRVVCVL